MSSAASGRGRTGKKARNLLDMIPARNPGVVYEILPPGSAAGEKEGTGAGRASLEPSSGPSRRASGPRSPGTVSILVPRFRGRLGRGFCRIAGVGEYIRVNLDSYGTFVWLSMDGRSSVRELGRALREEFGPGVEPVHERLAAFLSILERNALISYTKGEKELIPKRHASGEPR